MSRSCLLLASHGSYDQDTCVWHAMVQEHALKLAEREGTGASRHGPQLACYLTPPSHGALVGSQQKKLSH